MNINQLERIRTMVRSIRAEIETDISGSGTIQNRLEDLEVAILDSLKSMVWKRYLEEVE